jgi:hypothetical protein
VAELFASAAGAIERQLRLGIHSGLIDPVGTPAQPATLTDAAAYDALNRKQAAHRAPDVGRRQLLAHDHTMGGPWALDNRSSG